MKGFFVLIRLFDYPMKFFKVKLLPGTKVKKKEVVRGK